MGQKTLKAAKRKIKREQAVFKLIGDRKLKVGDKVNYTHNGLPTICEVMAQALPSPNSLRLKIVGVKSTLELDKMVLGTILNNVPAQAVKFIIERRDNG